MQPHTKNHERTTMQLRKSHEPGATMYKRFHD